MYTSDLTQRGYPPDEIARLVRTGELVRIRRGAYLTNSEHAIAGVRAAHLRLIRATTLAQCPTEAVVSHMSAAVIHGLPIWTEGLDRVHVTQNRRGGGKARRLVRVHGTPIEPDEVAVVSEIVVTSLARTVLDLACVLPMQSAVALGDAALRLGMLSAELDDRPRDQHLRPFLGSAARAVAAHPTKVRR